MRERCDVLVVAGVPGPEDAIRLEDLETIGRVRARLKGRIMNDEIAARIAVRLVEAKFGVVAFDPARLDGLTLESLSDLVIELNRKTRFSMVRAPGEGDVEGVNEVSLWLTGRPLAHPAMANARVLRRREQLIAHSSTLTATSPLSRVFLN